MQPDPITCALHEQKILQILAAVNDLSGKMGDAAKNQAVIVAGLEGLRREMDIGFQGVYRRQDATNGRVTTLEGKTGRLEADMAAQEAFTPGLFKAVDGVKEEVGQRERDLWSAVNELRRSEKALAVSDAHNEGYTGGITHAAKIAWALFGAIALAAGWALGMWMQHAK